MSVSSYIQRIQLRARSGEPFARGTGFGLGNLPQDAQPGRPGALTRLGSRLNFGGGNLNLPHGAARLLTQAQQPGGVLSDEQYQRLLAAATTQQAEQERQAGMTGANEAARAGAASALGSLAAQRGATAGARGRGGTASQVAAQRSEDEFGALQGLANALSEYERKQNELAIFNIYKQHQKEAREFQEWLGAHAAAFGIVGGVSAALRTEPDEELPEEVDKLRTDDSQVPYYIRRPKEGDRGFLSYDPSQDDPLYYIRRPSSGSTSERFSSGSSRGLE